MKLGVSSLSLAKENPHVPYGVRTSPHGSIEPARTESMKVPTSLICEGKIGVPSYIGSKKGKVEPTNGSRFPTY